VFPYSPLPFVLVLYIILKQLKTCLYTITMYRVKTALGL
jgi:hypothetical protein